MKTYNIGTCTVPGCGKVLSNAGFARVAHMRAHVRKGEAAEVRKLGADHRPYASFLVKEEDRVGILPYRLGLKVQNGFIGLAAAERLHRDGFTDVVIIGNKIIGTDAVRGR